MLMRWSVVLAGLAAGLVGWAPTAGWIDMAPAMAQTAGQRQADADRLFNQALQQTQTSQLEAALRSYQKALVIYRELNNRLWEGNALANLGLVWFSLDDYGKAIDYQEKSLAISRELHDQIGEEGSLGNLGIAHHALGNYSKAIDYYEKQLVIIHKLKNQRHHEGSTLGNLGNAYHALGNYAKAIAYHEQHLTIARELNNLTELKTALANLGSDYRKLGDYTKAIEYHKLSLVIARKLTDLSVEAVALGNLGSDYTHLGNYAKAIEYHAQSLGIARQIKAKHTESAALSDLGIIYYLLGNHREANEYHRQSLAISREIGDKTGEGASLSNLGIGFLQISKLVEAESTLRSAISVWESLRAGLTDTNKVSLAETQASTYRLLQRVLVRQKRPEAALEIAEQGRARAFAELLASRLQHKSIAEIQAIAKAPNLEAIRRIAKTQNATLVEYSIIDQSTLYIWVIKPTGEITFHATTLDAKSSILQLVEYSRGVMGVRGQHRSAQPEPSQAALNQLHKLLITPIIADLPQDPSQRIIFLPQGPLFLVPFAALQDDQGQYLIDQHTLSTAPSIQTLQLTHEQAKLAQTNGNKLIVGDPAMPLLESGQLPNLPGARQEAIAIAKILNTQPLLGAQATKAAVVKQMPNAAVIHLATHGLLRDVKGDVPGAIVFAASGQDNGLLSASEIFDLKLQADLIVLSACDTGRGAITGDGVIGLSRSLIAAGAPSIVVSLWSVDDRSTSVLMSEFYRNLKTNPDKAQALRQATLTTKKTFPNPRDWAAFTLIGESNRD